MAGYWIYTDPSSMEPSAAMHPTRGATGHIGRHGCDVHTGDHGDLDEELHWSELFESDG